MVQVKHSQRMNESPLKAWILANMNGKIICGHCNCLAGLSETCSHVAAICFAVSSIGESRDIVSSDSFRYKQICNGNFKFRNQ